MAVGLAVGNPEPFDFAQGKLCRRIVRAYKGNPVSGRDIEGGFPFVRAYKP